MEKEGSMSNRFMFLPGYFKCKRILKKLTFFKDLIAHEMREPIYLRNARPLEDLLPETIGKEKSDAKYLLKREINRLIPSVRDCFYLAQIETSIDHISTEYNYDYKTERNLPREKITTYDFLTHYFEIPKAGNTTSLIMSCMDRAIGWYLNDKEAAFRDLFNPIAWFAKLLKLPLFILNSIGIHSDNKIVSDIYSLFIKLLMVLILAFIATKLGISLPWDKIVGLWR